MKKCILLIMALLVLVMPAAAAIPKMISVQGQLTDLNDNIMTGTVNLEFVIQTTSGTTVWGPEVHSGVVLTPNGIFNVVLGSILASGINLDFSQNYQLQIKVTKGTTVDTLAPIPLTSVAYAYYAEVANVAPGSIGTTQIADKGVATADIADNAITAAQLAGTACSEVCTDATGTGGGGAAADVVCNGCVGSSDIGSGQVGNANIQNAVITQDKLVYSIIGTNWLADNAVTANKLYGTACSEVCTDATGGTATDLACTTGCVSSSEIAADAIISAKILDGTITSADVGFNYAGSSLAGGAATSALTASGLACTTCVDTTDIASNAITGSKILDGEVHVGDLSDNAVTSAKIVDSTIVAADLAPGVATGVCARRTKTCPSGASCARLATDSSWTIISGTCDCSNDFALKASEVVQPNTGNEQYYCEFSGTCSAIYMTMVECKDSWLAATS